MSVLLKQIFNTCGKGNNGMRKSNNFEQFFTESYLFHLYNLKRKKQTNKQLYGTATNTMIINKINFAF